MPVLFSTPTKIYTISSDDVKKIVWNCRYWNNGEVCVENQRLVWRLSYPIDFQGQPWTEFELVFVEERPLLLEVVASLV